MPVQLADGLTLYTVEELGEILDIQPKTIRALLKEGRLRGRKMARRWYVTDRALKEYFGQPEPQGQDEEDDDGS